MHGWGVFLEADTGDRFEVLLTHSPPPMVGVGEGPTRWHFLASHALRFCTQLPPVPSPHSPAPWGGCR